MAATSYSTLPSSTYAGYGSQGDSHRATNYGTYDSGVGLLTSHPYQYQTNNYGANFTDSQQQSLYFDDHPQSNYSTQQPQNIRTNKPAQQSTNNQQLNDYSNSQTPKNNERSHATNNDGSYAATRTIQPPQKKKMDNQHPESKNQQQNPHVGRTRHSLPAPVDNESHQSKVSPPDHRIPNHPPKKQHHRSQPPSQSNLNRSNHEISKARVSSSSPPPPLPPAPAPPPPPPVRHRSPSTDHNNHVSETVPKIKRPAQDLRPTKSSLMLAAANKKKEEARELKRKGRFFPVSQNKATASQLKPQQTPSQTDAEQSDIEKTKRNKKPAHPLSKTPKSSHSDGEETDTKKTKRNKNRSHSQPKQRPSRRDDYHTEDNNSSADEDENHKGQQSKSKKRTKFPDSHSHQHQQLPPIRRNRMPPHHDAHSDHPLPSGHPLKGRFSYDDYPPHESYPGRYDHRHLYEDAQDIPPYLGAYHDAYDGFFDYEKRKAKPKQNKDRNDPHIDHEDSRAGMNGHETEHDDDTKSQLSRKSKHKTTTHHHDGGRRSRRDYEENARSHWPPEYYPQDYYGQPDMLELWRQERNDYLKKKFKPTIHDVLYSQQWMKSDSYLENQRRRALRDIQGYYFPYKKYTLKDYKDMQKLYNQNPFADVNEISIDRKERAKKRQEYGTLIERQMVDNAGTRHIPPREMLPRKPWHLSGGAGATAETHDPDMTSKRERVSLNGGNNNDSPSKALEYAKEQVVYRPVQPKKTHSYLSNSTEQDVNKHFVETNDDGDGSNTERTSQPHQSYND